MSMNLASLMQQLASNSGDNLKPVPQVGAAVQPPLPSPGFDPMSYGQTSGEATFFGQGPSGMTPLAALGSIGVGQGGGGKAPMDINGLLAMIRKLMEGGGGKQPSIDRPGSIMGRRGPVGEANYGSDFNQSFKPGLGKDPARANYGSDGNSFKPKSPGPIRPGSAQIRYE